jgi:hypothetical protein
MRSLAEIFLHQRSELSSSLESSIGQDQYKIVEEYISGVGDSYLRQDDCPDWDKEIAPQCIELIGFSVRYRALPQAPARTPSALVDRSTSNSESARSLQGMVLVLVVVAAGSVIIGTTTLSLLLVAGLGALAHLAGGGVIFGRSTKDWPLSLVFGKADPDAQTDAAARRRAEEDYRQSISDYMVGLEGQCRHIDALLDRFREQAAPEPLPGSEVHLNSIHLQFLQDLSEAAAADDSAYAIAVVRKRLPAVARSLGVQLSQFSDGSEAWFAIDEEPDVTLKGTTRTVRPAVMRGDTCLARGYARRHV